MAAARRPGHRAVADADQADRRTATGSDQSADGRTRHRRRVTPSARLRRCDDRPAARERRVGLMFTDEQRSLDEAVARLLAKTSSPEQVRAAEPDGFDQAVWDGLIEMGLLEAAASGEASTADLAVVARQCGAHLALVPFVDTVATAGDDRWRALSASWF